MSEPPRPDTGDAPAGADADLQPALRLVEAMRADGVDVTDEDAVRRWLQTFNERPVAERIEVLGVPDAFGPATEVEEQEAEEPPTLPAVRLAPEPELAAAARTASLFVRAGKLAEWVGQRRQVTDSGVLRFADAREAVRELDLLGGERDPEAALKGLRSTSDLPELHLPWTVAFHLGMLTVEGRRASTGPATAIAADGSDEEVLTLWHETFGLVTGSAECCPGLIDIAFSDAGVPYFQDHLSGVLLDLYVTGEPVAMDDLVTSALERMHALLEELDEDGPTVGDAHDEHEVKRTHQQLLTHLPGVLNWLSVLGAVEVTDDSAGAARTVALTPLGMWGVQQRAEAEGIRAPVVGGLADASAAELLEGVLDYENSEDVTAEYRDWLAQREPAEAATELLAAARDGSPGTRPLVFDVLSEVGEPALPAVRSAFEEAPLRPYARVWLTQQGDDIAASPEDPAELGWMVGDLCAVVLDNAAEEELDEQLAEFVEPGTLDHVIDALVRSEHPQKIDVLEAIGRQCSDKKAAKAAQKAAMKARSQN